MIKRVVVEDKIFFVNSYGNRLIKFRSVVDFVVQKGFATFGRGYARGFSVYREVDFAIFFKLVPSISCP